MFTVACAELFQSVKKIIQQQISITPVWPKKKNVLTLVKLISAVCVYAFTLKYVGFLVATICFIFICSWVLGERRKMVLFLSSFVFVLCFWALLKYGLDIYIESGSLFLGGFQAINLFSVG